MVFYRVVLIFIFSLSSIEGLKSAKRFTFKLDNAYKEEMLQELQRHNFSFLYEVIVYRRNCAILNFYFRFQFKVVSSSQASKQYVDR